MSLYTLPYLPDGPDGPDDPTIGLPDLRKGLCTILTGYLLLIFTALSAGILLWYAVAEVRAAAGSRKPAEGISTAVFTGVIVLGLLSLYSLWLVVRGKWMCLMSAPEEFNARWLMFAAIVCVLTGPALNFGANLLAGADAATAALDRDAGTTEKLAREIDSYRRGVPRLNTRAWIRVAGDVAGMLSSVFFVLFLRAVALAWGKQAQARLAEWYLCWLVLLVVGGAMLAFRPALAFSQPLLVLGLAGGLLLAGVWYLLLIVGAIASISGVLAGRR